MNQLTHAPGLDVVPTSIEEDGQEASPNKSFQDLLLLGHMADQARADFKFMSHVDVGLSNNFKIEEFYSRAWSRWFGSRKAALKAEGLLRTAKGSEVTHFLKRTRHNAPLMLLNLVWGSEGITRLFTAALPQATMAEADPNTRMMAVGKELRSKYGIDEPFFYEDYDAWDSEQYIQISKRVEAAWPFMADIHGKAGYCHRNACMLLFVDAFCRLLERESVAQNDIPVITLGVFLTMATLSPRLQALAAIHRASVARCYCFEHMFSGVTAMKMDRSKSIWEQVEEGDFDGTVAQIIIDSRRGHPFDKAQAEIIAHAVQASCLARRMQGLYQDVRLALSGEPFYVSACLELEQNAQGNQVLADRLAIEDFPTDLIRPTLDIDSVERPEKVLALLKRLFIRNEDAMEASDDLQRSELGKSGRLQELQAKIKELVDSGSLERMKEISVLAEEASRLGDETTALMVDALIPLIKDYVDGWRSFYAAVDSLPRQGLLSEEPAPDVVEVAVALQQPHEVSELAQAVKDQLASLNEELVMAHADNDHLSSELNEVRASLHRLRGQLENKQEDTVTPVTIDAVDSVYRVGTRQNFSPSDVLAFFAATASDRVEFLDTAVEGAKAYPVPYDACERMLDMMAKLVGPYLDALRSGQPDAVARNVFGSKAYSAKESDTTLSVPRMRAMREFNYLGQKKLFVQHLRVSNEVGARGMRIYFCLTAAPGNEKKVVVAYVGPHLEVSSST